MSLEADSVELTTLRHRIDDALAAFLTSSRAELEALDPSAVVPLDEVVRLVAAGGKRLRPILCYWGHRAGGETDDESIVRAAAALELLHTMALIHDDVMDDAGRRRGVPTSHVFLAEEARRLGLPGEAEQVGASLAILTGDLAAVMADRLFHASGFGPEAIVRALSPYHDMRMRMAAGQYLDIAGAARDAHSARRVAGLKGGAYTVEGPLLVGAALASAPPEVEAALRAFGRPLGAAFQLRDDLRDRDAAPGVSADDVRELVDLAKAALETPALSPGAVDVLGMVADSVASA